MDRILLLLNRGEQRHQLAQWLAGSCEVLIAEDGDALADRFDLCLLDVPALERLREAIGARKGGECGLFLPFLLVAARRELGVAARHLGRTVDELLLAPVERVELRARVESLLRARSYSSLSRHVLRRSEEKFRALFHNSSDAVFIHDTQGRIIEANHVAASRLGYSREELLQRSLANICAPEYASLVPVQIQGALQRGRISFETIHVRRDGSHFPVEVASRVIELDGGVGVLSTARDITERKRVGEERKRLEEHLRRVQKMEAIGTLAGGIAHDFNNILGAIIGYSEMMEVFDVPQGSPLYASLQEVLKAAHRAKELVQQILTFSRRSDDEPKPVDMGPIIKEALKFLRASLPSTIQIRLELRSEGSTILADPTKIHQLLMNLCANAGHAMAKEGGELRVELTDLPLDERAGERFAELEPGAYLQLAVSDTGYGMSTEVMEKIFDPYFTTKRRGEGTGLGLAIVEGIVKSHGGAITVESSPGEGTTFRILFPKIDTETAERGVQTAPLPKGCERILLVDDEAALIGIGKRILERLGYQVVPRTDSLEALETFRSAPQGFDLVVTDLTMPRMTGVQLAAELLRIRPDIPIILCTGFTHRITQEEARSAGIGRIIEKPLGIRDLADAVREMLNEAGSWVEHVECADHR